MSRWSRSVGFREAWTAIESNRVAYIITVVSFFALFNVVVGSTLLPELLEPVELIGAALSGIAVGWVLYELVKARRAKRGRERENVHRA